MSEPLLQDHESLRILAAFHFVVAGLALLVALFPVLHLILGIAIVTQAVESASDAWIPLAFGWFFVVLAGGWILVGIAFAIALVVAGRALQTRRRYTFCLTMAGVACVFVPFGTILGTFTIIVLMRDPVKALFSLPTAPAR